MAEVEEQIIDLTLIPEEEAISIIMELVGCDDIEAKFILFIMKGNEKGDLRGFSLPEDVPTGE